MASGIHWIDLGVNCYLIDVECGRVLIDTGFPSKQDKLDAVLAAAGCGPGDLRLIVLTHGDLDHAGNCAHLRRIHGTPIAIHREDAEMVRSGDMGVGRKDKPDRQAPMFRLMVWTTGLLTRITGTGADIEAFEPDVLLEDGQDLTAYGLEARVVHLPGHSSGSIAILTGDGDLFCGDPHPSGGEHRQAEWPGRRDRPSRARQAIPAGAAVDPGPVTRPLPTVMRC